MWVVSVVAGAFSTGGGAAGDASSAGDPGATATPTCAIGGCCQDRRATIWVMCQAHHVLHPRQPLHLLLSTYYTYYIYYLLVSIYYTYYSLLTT